MPTSIRVGTVMRANTVHSNPLLQSYSICEVATIYTHYSYVITGFTITAHHNRLFREVLYTKVYSRSVDLSPEFWSGEFWSGGPKFSVENWSGRTDFPGKNGPPLENWPE